MYREKNTILDQPWMVQCKGSFFFWYICSSHTSNLYDCATDNPSPCMDRYYTNSHFNVSVYSR